VKRAKKKMRKRRIKAKLKKRRKKKEIQRIIILIRNKLKNNLIEQMRPSLVTSSVMDQNLNRRKMKNMMMLCMK